MKKQLQIRPCPGYPYVPGVKCGKKAGTPWTPIWCPECDAKRREHISKSLEELTKEFEAKS